MCIFWQEARHCFQISLKVFLFSLFAEEQQAFVVFISTDYVFDGTNPPYSTEDKPNPLNLYGKSKVEGEEIVMDASKGFAKN